MSHSARASAESVETQLKRVHSDPSSHTTSVAAAPPMPVSAPAPAPTDQSIRNRYYSKLQKRAADDKPADRKLVEIALDGSGSGSDSDGAEKFTHVQAPSREPTSPTSGFVMIDDSTNEHA